MHFIAYIIAGLIAGFIASKIVNKTGDGILIDVLLGLVGGVVGGWFFSLLGINFGQAGGLNIASIIVAVIGAVLLLVVYHAIRRNV